MSCRDILVDGYRKNSSDDAKMENVRGEKFEMHKEVNARNRRLNCADAPSYIPVIPPPPPGCISERR